MARSVGFVRVIGLLVVAGLLVAAALLAVAARVAGRDAAGRDGAGRDGAAVFCGAVLAGAGLLLSVTFRGGGDERLRAGRADDAGDEGKAAEGTVDDESGATVMGVPEALADDVPAADALPSLIPVPAPVG